MIPDIQELLTTEKRIRPYIHRTPVMTSTYLNSLSGSKLYFKCENFQRMGAFKMRGAVNAVSSLSEGDRKKGVVTHSSGNFAQAVSLSARLFDIPAHIVMPNNAPRAKVNAVKEYGGRVKLCPPTLAARQKEADIICNETAGKFLHPSNQIEVILGNSTAAKELIDDHSDLDAIICPVGGGGLLAGTALAAHYFGKDCKIYAGEPANVDDAFRSFHSGKIERNDSTETIADGLRTTLGDVNFPIIQELVTDIIRVEEKEIVFAMKLIWERMKIIIEPSCAVPLAAVLKSPELFTGKKIGIILSGGNVDLTNLPFRPMEK